MAVSVALQAGVPLEWFTAKLKNLQFEPSGPCTDPQIRYATSIMDALAKWLEHRFATVVTENSESVAGAVRTRQ